MDASARNDDRRLIEHGFPCHQVGAETQWERGASSALPPLYYLHVWWARRPLTPSRAAILASLLPADADPQEFVRSLGIERKQVEINGQRWTLVKDLRARIDSDEQVGEVLRVDSTVLRRLEKEDKRRAENRATISRIRDLEPSIANHPVLKRWEDESVAIPPPWPAEGEVIPVLSVMGDPAHVAERIEFAKLPQVKSALGKAIKWEQEDLYGYDRAFANSSVGEPTGLTSLDPTAGGGSIPFEALRLAACRTEAGALGHGGRGM